MTPEDTAELIRERAIQYIERAYEKIFFLSTGALALSITFKSSLTVGEPRWVFLLAVCWLCFASVSIGYIYYLISVANWLTQRHKNAASEKLDHWKTGYKAANAIMLFGFMGGIFFLFSFAIINLLA